jgi:ABC-2 type transport system ATP-binding protein
MANTAHALVLEGLKKTYKGGVEAVKGISLTVHQGDFFALLGPNGAGKSTTIGIISSLVQKSAGTVKVFDYDIDKQLEHAKLCIGLVPQEFNFNQFETVLQIVVNQAGYYGVPKSIALQRAEKYLSQLELWEKRNSQSRELSGGMKRRLMIARALMHEPKQGVTIILTTHYLEEAEMLCRNIGIIDNGVLVECTSMKALLSKLNMETFILDLRRDIQTAPVLNGMACRLTDPHTLEVDVAKEHNLNEVFRQLTTANIEVLSMRNKSNRLEELFVELVKKTQGVSA